MRMLVLGAGLQGAACAYDLAQTASVTDVLLADRQFETLPPFLAPLLGHRVSTVPLDVRDTEAVARAMRGCQVVLSAVPYYLNTALARQAIDAGAHFCDLGGNTEIVWQQKTLGAAALERGVSVVPDCGLAPGLVDILAQLGISQLEAVEAVRLYVGGLPQHPKPPLNYQVVYSLEGVLDYYTTQSWVLRDRQRVQVTALSEVEEIEFDAPVGRLEAFHTAGGLSTLAFRYEGQVPIMEYKTLRFPGHARIMEAVRDLGFFGLEPVPVKGVPVVPREVAVALMGPRLLDRGAPDLVVLRVVVSGRKAGSARTLAWELIDRMDEEHGITAMMRTTGYSLSVTGVMQGQGQIAPGVHTPDECVPAAPYLAELATRGIVVRQVAG
jgi:lysine 6-dehydrogenase